MAQQLASFSAQSFGILSVLMILGLGVIFTRVMLSGKGFIEFGLLAFLILSGITLGYSSSTQIVLNAKQLGVVKRVEVQEGVFSELSTLYTASGFYNVRGAVSAEKGDRLRLEKRAQGGDKICVGDDCYPKAR